MFSQADWAELADGLERAARVMWRSIGDPDPPWPKGKTLRVVAGLSQRAAEIRATLPPA